MAQSILGSDDPIVGIVNRVPFSAPPFVRARSPKVRENHLTRSATDAATARGKKTAGGIMLGLEEVPFALSRFFYDSSQPRQEYSSPKEAPLSACRLQSNNSSLTLIGAVE